MTSCLGINDGFYVNVASGCRTYTYCHQGIADVFRCLPGTLFNQEQNICEDENLVTCSFPEEHQQPIPAQENGVKGQGQVDSNSLDDMDIQKELLSLKEKLEERQIKLEERKRQIKFRELRELAEALRDVLDSPEGKESAGQPSSN